MNEEILKKLERKIGRRSFLRGSGLAAAAIIGVAATSSLTGYAQEQAQDEKKKTEEEKAAEEKAAAEKKAEAKKSASDDKNETKLDAEGREYRECPQCGGNMYRQGRTWTCENCGYSYVE